MERIENALGYYEKRDVPNGKVYFTGTAVQIEGRRWLFIPDDKNLRPVEAEPDA